MTSFGVVATVIRSGAGSERAPVRGVQVREKLKCLRVCVCAFVGWGREGENSWWWNSVSSRDFFYFTSSVSGSATSQD